MGSGIRIALAGTLSWIAFVFCYHAIFKWDSWPWGGYDDDMKLIWLFVLPPVVIIVSCLLFRLALGAQFLSSLSDSKSKLIPVIFFGLLLVSISNARTAADIADSAYDAARDAEVAAQDAKSAARDAEVASQDAESAARSAASTARDAASTSEIAAIAAQDASEAASNAALSCSLR